MDELRTELRYLREDIREIKDLCKESAKKNHEQDVRLTEYNALLEEHIRGVNQNRDTIKVVASELKSHKEEDIKEFRHFKAQLEPFITQRKALKWLKNFVIGIGTIAGSVYGIGRLFGWF
jgi:dynactin complex subunit